MPKSKNGVELNLDVLHEIRANLFNLGMSSMRWGIVDPIVYPKSDKNDRAGTPVASVLWGLEEGSLRDNPKGGHPIFTSPRPIFSTYVWLYGGPIIKDWATKTVKSCFNLTYKRDLPLIILGAELTATTKEAFETAETLFPDFASLSPWTYINKQNAEDRHPRSFFKDSGFMIQSINYSVVLKPVKEDSDIS